MSSKQTPSQTVGPFFAYGMTPEQYGYDFASIAGATVEGIEDSAAVTVEGHVFDGAGTVIGDAVIEIWQADTEGRYNHPNDQRSSNQAFKGFARWGTGTDPENRFVFRTVKPGPVDSEQAPHINVIVFMRGMPNHAYTRLYFPDEVGRERERPRADVNSRRTSRHLAGGKNRTRRWRRIPVRHSYAGRRRNRLLRCLTRSRI